MKLEFGDNRTLDRRSWMRLMGVTGAHLATARSDERTRAAIERLRAQMEEAEPLLFDAAEPAFTYEVIEQDSLNITGVSLQKHLDGCGRMVLMAVTLGEEVDRLISRAQESRIAFGVVLDCGASVMAEMAAEEAEARIRRELANQTDPAGQPEAVPNSAPLFMTGRFSPGYGDSPLEMQRQVLELLDAEKRLGITLSKGCMMSPSKSITAILGLADHPVTGRLATCAECVLRDKCQIRREGRTCSTALSERSS